MTIINSILWRLQYEETVSYCFMPCHLEPKLPDVRWLDFSI